MLRLIRTELHITEWKNGKLEAYTMKRVAACAHLPTHFLYLSLRYVQTIKPTAPATAVYYWKGNNLVTEKSTYIDSVWGARMESYMKLPSTINTRFFFPMYQWVRSRESDHLRVWAFGTESVVYGKKRHFGSLCHESWLNKVELTKFGLLLKNFSFILILSTLFLHVRSGSWSAEVW